MKFGRQQRLLLISLLACLLVACAQRGTPIEAEPAPTLLDHPTGELPERISGAGLFADAGREIPSERVIPYRLRYPLYSDDNDKSRYLFLPPGKKIDNSEAQQWQFPEGTLVFKTFYLTTHGNRSMPARKIETRLLQRLAHGWRTATYQWNAEGSEAFLTDGNDVRFSFVLPHGNYTYAIPGRFSCLACHQPQPNFVIGFEMIRLSGVQGASGKPQLAELIERNVFQYPEKILAVEIPGADLEREALGYLHGNCAHCHNPASPIYHTTGLDLRYWNLKANTVNVVPQKFAATDSSVLRIAPGRPEQSLLFQLMAHTYSDSTQFMPPIGISVIDTTGLELVRKWIESL